MSLTEVILRHEVTSPPLTRGFDIYLPVVDQGIDVIAHHEGRGELRPVQQKSRWTIDRKYHGRGIWIAFRSRGDWFLAPHDEMVGAEDDALRTSSWRDKGTYHRKNLLKSLQAQYAMSCLSGGRTDAA